MQRKLTRSEEKAYKQAALKIYQAEGHPEHLHQQCIKMDIRGMNQMLEWTDKMNRNPSPALAMEALEFFLNQAKKEKQELKSLGCSDREVAKLTQVTAMKLLDQVDILKKVQTMYAQANESCLNKMSNLQTFNLFQPEKECGEKESEASSSNRYKK